MKSSLIFLLCLVAVTLTAAVSTPLNNAILQSAMNGNGQTISNAVFIGSGAGITNLNTNLYATLPYTLNSIAALSNLQAAAIAANSNAIIAASNANYTLALTVGANGTNFASSIGQAATNLNTLTSNAIPRLVAGAGVGIANSGNLYTIYSTGPGGAPLQVQNVIGTTNLLGFQIDTNYPYSVLQLVPDGSGGYYIGGGGALSLTNDGIHGAGYVGNGYYLTGLPVTNGFTTNSIANIPSIYFFGAKGTVYGSRTNDDTAAVQAAANSGLPVYFPPGAVFVTGNLNITNNGFCFIGENSEIDYNANSNGTHLNFATNVAGLILKGMILDGKKAAFTGTGDGATTNSWNFVATNQLPAYSATAARNAVQICGSQANCFISDCVIQNYSLDALDIFSGEGTTPQPGFAGPHVSNLSIVNCYRGIHEQYSAEYCNLDGIFIKQSGIGVVIEAGNEAFNNLNVTDCGLGVYIDGIGFPNPGHGLLGNSMINHNDIGLIAMENNLGYDFVNVHFDASGGIIISNCTGMNFIGCRVGETFINVYGGDGMAGVNTMVNPVWPGNCPITRYNGGILAQSGGVNNLNTIAPYSTNDLNTTFTGTNTFANAAGNFSGNGAGITNLATSSYAATGVLTSNDWQNFSAPFYVWAGGPPPKDIYNVPNDIQGTGLSLWYSLDGKTLYPMNPDGTYQATNNSSLRDEGGFVYDNKIYVPCNIQGQAVGNFTNAHQIMMTEDGVNWSSTAVVQYSANTAVVPASPDIAQIGTNAYLYYTINTNYTANRIAAMMANDFTFTNGFQTAFDIATNEVAGANGLIDSYLTQFTNATPVNVNGTLTTWSNMAVLVVYHGGNLLVDVYTNTVSNFNAGQMMHLAITNVLQGRGVEAPALLQMPNGNWRIYFSDVGTLEYTETNVFGLWPSNSTTCTFVGALQPFAQGNMMLATGKLKNRIQTAIASHNTSLAPVVTNAIMAGGVRVMGNATLNSVTTVGRVSGQVVNLFYTNLTNVLIDLSLGNNFALIMTTNTFFSVTNSYPGQDFKLQALQDNFGTHAAAFNTNIFFGSTNTFLTNAHALNIVTATTDMNSLGAVVTANYAVTYPTNIPPVTSALAAWSVSRKPYGCQAPYSCLVRRSTDAGTAVIGWVGTNLDTNTLIAFAAGGDVYVRCLFDLSGNGKNLYGFYNNRQPNIVTAGALVTGPNGKPAMAFSGSGTELFNTNFNGINVQGGFFATAVISRPWGTSKYAAVFETTDYGGGSGIGFLASSGSLISAYDVLSVGNGFGGAGPYVYGVPASGFINSTNNNTFHIMATALGGSGSVIMLDGTNMVQTVSDQGLGNQTNQITLGGNYVSNGDFFDGNISEVIIWPSMFDASIRKALSDDCNNAHGHLFY